MPKIYFQPISDLHMDGSPLIIYKNPTVDYKQVILSIAGDANEIDSTPGRSKKLVQTLTRLSEMYRAVVYVPGNHEYYGGKINTADQKLKQWMSDVPNFHYLNCDHVKIDNYNFIGATLWTDFDKGNPVKMLMCQQYMNDYRYIRKLFMDKNECHKITTGLIAQLNKQHLQFITDKLNELKGEKNIVVTHHSPSYKSVCDRYRGDPINAGYHNELDDLIEDMQPILWQHGHVHSSHRYKIGKTTVVANPRGYTHFTTRSKKEVELHAAELHKYSYMLEGWGESDKLESDLIVMDCVQLINRLCNTENEKYNYNLLINLANL
jgi:Icc-related predicted phosphoesterase